MAAIVASVVAALLATFLAWFLVRRVNRPRQVFNWVVVVVAIATLLNLPPFDNGLLDKLAQSLLHLVEGASLVALVGPALTEQKPAVATTLLGAKGWSAPETPLETPLENPSSKPPSKFGHRRAVVTKFVYKRAVFDL